ncbi:MAG: succinyl-CoA--3-ketoacid-CoA transferase [Spirochaetae bacterium HGW-Spirochaetae-7]|jgi:acetate CoA/acetoacetate CoA-transferase beta subunit|nr:MAG: succinyl-CoA--3-ketoacid-CoA transferase [Spirochaetae bacterium HGW-Spirochaetae-7]
MIEYVENKEIIARRIARFFKSGDVVNLGIGLPTMVGNFVPEGVTVILQSENGMMGLGPAPEKGKEDKDLTNAGAMPVTVLPGGCFFDSATSFGIIRGGHVDYTVLGVLEVDQEGNLANYKIPGKMVPGMGGAMDLVAGSKKVIASTTHLEKSGNSKLKRRCALPLTAAHEVDIVVTDVGYFTVKDGEFHLVEYFAPYNPEWVVEHTDADIIIEHDCKEFK